MSGGIPSKIQKSLQKIWVWLLLLIVLIFVSIIVVSVAPQLKEENIKKNLESKFVNPVGSKSFFNFPTPGSFSFKLFGTSTRVTPKSIPAPGANNDPAYYDNSDNYGQNYNDDNSWDVNADFWNEGGTDWNTTETNWSKTQTDWKTTNTNWKN